MRSRILMLAIGLAAPAAHADKPAAADEAAHKNLLKEGYVGTAAAAAEARLKKDHFHLMTVSRTTHGADVGMTIDYAETVAPAPPCPKGASCPERKPNVWRIELRCHGGWTPTQAGETCHLVALDIEHVD